MKLFRSFPIFGFLLFTIGCDKEPDPSPFLTIDVGFVDVNLANELWIFASDATGQLIDIQQMKRGKNFLKSVRNDVSMVDLTIVTTYEGAYTFTTYNDVTTERPVKINTFNPTYPDWNQVDLTISNYYEGGDPLSKLSITGGGSPSFDIQSFANGEFFTLVSVYASPGKLLITGYRGADAVYSMTNGIQTRLVLKLDFSKFEVFNDFITIPGANQGSVVGHSNQIYNGGNFWNFGEVNYDEDPFVKIGYIPGFDYYTTKIYKHDSHRWVDYMKVGSPVTNFSWPQNSITLADISQQNFKIVSSAPVDRITTKSGMVFNSRAVSWTVHGSGNGGGIRPDVPAVFLKRLNITSKEDFSFDEGEVISSGGTYTHEDFLEEKLYDGFQKRDFEYFKFGFR